MSRFIKYIKFALPLCMIACSSDFVVGRVGFKAFEDTECSFSYSRYSKSGSVECIERTFYLYLVNNSSLTSDTKCPISEEEYNRVSIGDVYKCAFKGQK